MSARSEITNLINSYARLLDAGDFTGVAAMFEHATWRSDATGLVLRGADEVLGVYQRIQLYDGSPRTRHLMTNISIEVADGASEATSECAFTVLQGVVPGEPIQIVVRHFA